MSARLAPAKAELTGIVFSSLLKKTYDCMDAGDRAPKVGALGDAGAVADDCMDAGDRATQEQLPMLLQV